MTRKRKATGSPLWQSRITRQSEEDPAELLAHPLNCRRHGPKQLEALKRTLDTVGWVQRVIVSERTHRILDGHARVELALQYDERVPVSWVKVSETEEALALATFDPIGAQAEEDEAAMTKLLEECSQSLPIFTDVIGLTHAALSESLGIATGLGISDPAAEGDAAAAETVRSGPVRKYSFELEFSGQAALDEFTQWVSELKSRTKAKTNAGRLLEALS